MVKIVGVRFRNAGKVYYFDPKGYKIKAGDHVIVETARGVEYGTVIGGIREVTDDRVVQPLKAVIRVATQEDDLRAEKSRAKEKDAMRICNEKIRKHKLDMKLIDAEYTFDNNKVLFYFTADGRIDFRELVKDLAAVFKMRIELRQIGVRDEAKMIGGLGICGRPFCCSQFLDGFMPVSIKMAKTQNLSLNPTKISGTCGRLMCCLKYEQNAYEDAAKRMPKVESFVQTPDGPGNVKSVDLLRETMKVSLDTAGPNEPLKCYHNCEVCVLRNGKGSRDGIEIPERPARYVEEKEEEEFAAPILTTPFYMDAQLEDAPVREKIGGAEAGEGKSRRRHRGGRRKSGTKSAGEGQQPEKQEKQESRQPAKQGGKQNPPKENHEKKNGQGGKPRPPKSQGPKQPQQPKMEAAEGGESGEAKRRRPHHRGGRRRNKGGEGSGSAPKSE